MSWLCTATAMAQKAYNVLDWKGESTVNTFLVQKMRQQYAQRKINFGKAVSSRRETISYIENLQKKFRGLLGNLPQAASLNAYIAGTIRADGYRIERLAYQSFAHHHVTANLYVPEGRGPFPAALLFCGHEDLAKATASYQQTAILFAQHGFVVLVIDPISQSERYQLTDAAHIPLTRGGTTEHTLLNAGSTIIGTSTAAFEMVDNYAGLNYLLTRKEVDSSRIGCIGNSGGAIQAMYFAAFDKRIKLVVPCSYLATRERTLELSGAADGCAQISNEGKQQLEMSDLLIAAAPNPVLILAGRYDFIDYPGTEEAYKELRLVYNSLGQSQKLSLYTVDDGHGISRPKRERAVTWFRKWMYGDSTFIHEKESLLHSDKELRVMNTPQVSGTFPDEVSIADYNRQQFDALLAARKTFLESGKTKLTEQVSQLLSINNSQEIEVEIKEDITKANIHFGRMIIRKYNEPPVPVLIAYPANRSQKTILWLPGNGKHTIADSVSLIESYLTQNFTVVIADLRGIGETEDKAEWNDPKYFNKEYRNALLSLHIGLPIAGQRTTDVLSVIDMIRANTRTSQQPIEIHASGMAAIPALHAALYSSSIGQVYLYNSLRSYKDLLQNPTRKDVYADIIPNVLSYYDIPDLVSLLGPKVHQVN